MTLGIEDCVKLTRQANSDNERMAILLLIGKEQKLLRNLYSKSIVFSQGHAIFIQPNVFNRGFLTI